MRYAISQRILVLCEDWTNWIGADRFRELRQVANTVIWDEFWSLSYKVEIVEIQRSKLIGDIFRNRIGGIL